MARHVFHRDFTACRAVALAVLIGLALGLGGVPTSHADRANTVLSLHQASVTSPAEKGCDWGGVGI